MVFHDNIEIQLTLCTECLGELIARLLIKQEDTPDASIKLLQIQLCLDRQSEGWK